MINEKFLKEKQKEMNEKEIQKGNKLIAEFLGYSIQNKQFQTQIWNSSNESYWGWEEDDIVCDENNNEVCDENNEPYFGLEDLPFNQSWDWMMPVVEKIESIKDEYHGRFGVHIVSNTCTIQATNFRPDKRIPDPPHYFDTVTLDSKLDSTWYAVVRFVKWFNVKENENRR